MENVKERINELKDVDEKEELVEKVGKFKKEELVEMMLELLGNKRKFKKGRKDEILEILVSGGSYGVEELAKMVGISGKNVSSQLTYLRKDGVKIGTRSNGKKFIESD
jgi:biotin operon repressor